jgi:hypothetical protein
LSQLRTRTSVEDALSHRRDARSLPQRFHPG